MENATEKQPISRKDFIRTLGLSGAALMATYCLGSVTACSSKKEDDPQPTTSTKLDFTLNLNDAANANLKTNGGFIYKDAIIVARTTTGDYVAVSKECTHKGFALVFQAGDQFHCDSHGSDFGTDGAVKKGPATVALKKYSTTLTGTTLRVFES